MYRVDVATARGSLPSPTGAGPNPNGYFEDKDPSGGVPGTIVPAEFMNMVQEEICNVVTDVQAGPLSLSKSTRTQLVQAIKAIVDARASVIPVGVQFAYAGTTAPTGYLLCFGQAVSRTTYADLFAAIGTAYGAGDGSTTFNLPDKRGRVSVGIDNMGGTAANRITNSSTGGENSTTRGGTGGAQTHTLTVNEMPSHTHTHASSQQSGAFVEAVSGSVGGVTNTGSTGGGAAHSNTQPWQADNWIIKF